MYLHHYHHKTNLQAARLALRMSRITQNTTNNIYMYACIKRWLLNKYYNITRFN